MMPENRVIIAGSREFTDQPRLNKVCRWIFKTARIPVSGTTIIAPAVELIRWARNMQEKKEWLLPDFQLTGAVTEKWPDQEGTVKWQDMP